eukprot:15426855-Heterocapsa_arctica.AAC.1
MAAGPARTRTHGPPVRVPEPAMAGTTSRRALPHEHRCSGPSSPGTCHARAGRCRPPVAEAVDALRG